MANGLLSLLVPRPMRLGGGSSRCQGGCPHLAVNAQHQQHREEEDGPEGRDGQLRHRLWVCQERQSRACGGKDKKEEEKRY